MQWLKPLSRASGFTTELRKRKALCAWLAILTAGQLLCFAGITTVFIVGLVGLFAVGLPYPPAFRSIVARAVAGLLLAFSLVQVAAVIQFFALPTSRFTALSFLTSMLALVCVLSVCSRLPKAEPLVIANRKDAGAALAACMFIVPFALLCFWKNDPLNITTFASLQSADGSNHYTAIAEMSSTQHLNYREVQYYPKGFHVASALFMDGVHANQHDLNWRGNARVYAGLYIVWGGILAFMVVYLAVQLLEAFTTKAARQWHAILLMAVTIGLPLGLLYLFPFAYQGFINFYYICAATVCGLLFLYGYKPQEPGSGWWLIAYLLLAFGISMSWGPLLIPALLLIPLLYMLSERYAWLWLVKRGQYWWVGGAFIAQAIPLYLHLAYARLTAQQGFNAIGDITAFHFGLVLAGFVTLCYVLIARGIPSAIQRFAHNVLVPFYLLVVAFMCVQYLTVGELRYYAIKTSYLLEIVVLALMAALAIAAALHSSMSKFRQWIIAPTLFFAALILLGGLTGNPLDFTRQLLRGYEYIIASSHHPDPDVVKFTALGEAGNLASTNNTVLHYDPATGRLYGNVRIPNWANLMQYTTDSTPESGLCSGRIFSALAYSGSNQHGQETLIANVNDCIAQALARHRPYYIVTDTASLPHVRAIFGDRVKYVY